MIFRGKVKRGKRRGQSLGFPTANISLHQKLTSGIYISKTRYSRIDYPSISYIGAEKILETYILDNNFDLYDKWISVELIKKLRNSKKFNNTLDLIDAIKLDVKLAKDYFK